VAIDYMRVVTFGRDLPGQPHVADALLRVGQLEESLKSPLLAADVYRQLIKEFPAVPAAASARSNLQRLGASRGDDPAWLSH
jgi:TolA-binding protein